MDDKTENRDDDQAGSPDQGKVNDPLIRSDVEAPRADFEGRTPKDD